MCSASTHVRTCPHQEERNVSFSESFAYMINDWNNISCPQIRSFSYPHPWVLPVLRLVFHGHSSRYLCKIYLPFSGFFSESTLIQEWLRTLEPAWSQHLSNLNVDIQLQMHNVDKQLNLADCCIQWDQKISHTYNQQNRLVKKNTRIGFG